VAGEATLGVHPLSDLPRAAAEALRTRRRDGCHPHAPLGRQTSHDGEAPGTMRPNPPPAWRHGMGGTTVQHGSALPGQSPVRRWRSSALPPMLAAGAPLLSPPLPSRGSPTVARAACARTFLLPRLTTRPPHPLAPLRRHMHSRREELQFCISSPLRAICLLHLHPLLEALPYVNSSKWRGEILVFSVEVSLT
jgi:hypothetical protein